MKTAMRTLVLLTLVASTLAANAGFYKYYEKFLDSKKKPDMKKGLSRMGKYFDKPKMGFEDFKATLPGHADGSAYDVIDRDEDGVIWFQELMAYSKYMVGNPHARHVTEPPTDASDDDHEIIVQNMLRQANPNGLPYATKKQFANWRAKQAFDGYDADQDGVVTHHEMASKLFDPDTIAKLRHIHQNPAEKHHPTNTDVHKHPFDRVCQNPEHNRHMEAQALTSLEAPKWDHEHHEHHESGEREWDHEHHEHHHDGEHHEHHRDGEHDHSEHGRPDWHREGGRPDWRHGGKPWGEHDRPEHREGGEKPDWMNRGGEGGKPDWMNRGGEGGKPDWMNFKKGGEGKPDWMNFHGGEQGGEGGKPDWMNFKKEGEGGKPDWMNFHKGEQEGEGGKPDWMNFKKEGEGGKPDWMNFKKGGEGGKPDWMNFHKGEQEGEGGKPDWTNRGGEGGKPDWMNREGGEHQERGDHQWGRGGHDGRPEWNRGADRTEAPVQEEDTDIMDDSNFDDWIDNQLMGMEPRRRMWGGSTVESGCNVISDGQEHWCNAAGAVVDCTTGNWAGCASGVWDGAKDVWEKWG